MRDFQVRRALRGRLAQQHAQEPDTLVLDELGLCTGDTRIDVAVLNGSIHGYEIKSERDDLSRLARQVAVYGRVLDTVTLVVARNHVAKALPMIPEWWGVDEVAADGEDILFSTTRPATQNPNQDSGAIVQLLWRDEALVILGELGIATGVRSKPRQELWRRLAAALPLDDLKLAVREVLKHREGWRAPAPPS